MLDLKWIKNPLPEPAKTEKLNIANNMMINMDMIKNLNPDECSDHDLYKLCSDFDRISNVLFRDQDNMIRLLSNVRFITILTQVAYKINMEPFQRTQLCNAIYVLTKNHDITNQIRALLNNLAKVINRDIMPLLLELGFNEELSGAICIARFSSSNNLDQVRRINWQLINISQELDITTVVKTYEALGYFERFTDLFNGIMFNVIPSDQMNEKQQHNYSIISSALFDMLDGIPMNLCYTLLRSFTGSRSFTNLPLRVNLYSGSANYQRLNQTLQNLQMYENIVVPYV